MFDMAAGEATHQRLTDLRNALLQLHRTLLNSERAAYEHSIEKIQSPNHLLGLVMNDPWFAYLRELSGFVVLIDETLEFEDEPATPADADTLIARASELLRPREEGTGFSKSYYEAMQRDPDVILAHAAVMRLIAKLAA